MNEKGDMAGIIQMFMTAIIFVFMFYIYLLITAPIIENMLFPFLASGSGTAIGNPIAIQVLFQLIPLVLLLVGFFYILNHINKPPQQQQY